jgi:hypothetical protein
MRPIQRFSDEDAARTVRRFTASAFGLSSIVLVLWGLGLPDRLLGLIPVFWLLPFGMMGAVRINQRWYDKTHPEADTKPTVEETTLL